MFLLEIFFEGGWKLRRSIIFEIESGILGREPYGFPKVFSVVIRKVRIARTEKMVRYSVRSMERFQLRVVFIAHASQSVDIDSANVSVYID